MFNWRKFSMIGSAVIHDIFFADRNDVSWDEILSIALVDVVHLRRIQL